MRSVGILLCALLFAAPAFGQSYPPPNWSTPALGVFVTMEDSALSDLASQIPRAYQVPAVDTSSWTQYDVTTIGGTNPPGPADFSSCADLDRTGSQDNSRALNCMLRNSGREALLYFPDGIYDFGQPQDNNSVFRPNYASSQRGLVGQSRNAILNLTSSAPTSMIFIEGEENEYNGGQRAWNGGSGGTRGTTVIPVSSTAGFSTTQYAPGSWVHLRANPNGIQDRAPREYYTRVVGINSNSITIRDPLPDDFNGGGATAQPWNPCEEWVLRSLTIRFEDQQHQTATSLSMTTKSMAHAEITNVGFDGGYRSFMHVVNGADIRIHHSDFYNPFWDKATNGYGLIVARTSRAWFHDNHMQHVTGFAFSGSGQEIMLTFNDIRSPNANPEFDVQCTEPDGSGTNNDCIQASEARNPTNYSGPPTYTGAQANSECSGNQTPYTCCTGSGSGTCQDVYTHCSRHYKDLAGYDGDASCRGTAAGAVYSCAEWHNQSSSHGIFMRNYCEGSMWFDDVDGPGRGNFYYGNWFSDDSWPGGSPRFPSSAGAQGDFYWRGGFAFLPPGYRNNAIFANNLFEGDFGSGYGYNAYGDGMQVWDSVIAGECRYQGTDDPSGGQCSAAWGDVTDGQGDVWLNNAVGRDTHPAPRAMPSLPGFTDWPAFSVSPNMSAPYVGPDMGDPDATQKCLPAWQRYNGGC